MIYFLTYNKLPDDDASAVRNINMARIFMDCGYNTKLIGMGTTGFLEKKEYENLCYISLRLSKVGIFTKFRNYFNYKNHLKKVLLNEADDIEAFVVNMLPLNTLKYIKNIAKQKEAILFVDCCEWYSPEQFKWGKLDFNYLRNMYFVQNYCDDNTYPIAISKYLQNYFVGKNCKAIRIPVIMDIENMSYKKRTSSDNLNLVYAGSPGKKDYLNEIIEGIALLEQNIINKINIRIIGINKKQLIHMCAVSQQAINKLGDSLNAIGRIPREDVLENLEEADFTILMRSSTQRYAKAGFPTKVVESLASGTPVICNITSDLGDYIFDGENGIIVEECSAESVSIAIKKAFNLTFEQRKSMYENSRKCAEEFFNYKHYEDSIKRLLEGKYNDFKVSKYSSNT